MTTPTTIITSLNVRDHTGGYWLEYEVDDDLGRQLRALGVDCAHSTEATHVLVSLDVDGMPTDCVRLSRGVGRLDGWQDGEWRERSRGGDVEVIDRTIAALQQVREQLVSPRP